MIGKTTDHSKISVFRYTIGCLKYVTYGLKLVGDVVRLLESLCFAMILNKLISNNEWTTNDFGTEGGNSNNSTTGCAFCGIIILSDSNDCMNSLSSRIKFLN